MQPPGQLPDPENRSPESSARPAVTSRRRFLKWAIGLGVVVFHIPIISRVVRHFQGPGPVSLGVAGPLQLNEFATFQLPANQLVSARHVYLRPYGARQAQVCVEFVFLGEKSLNRRIQVTATVLDRTGNKVAEVAEVCSDGRVVAEELSGGGGAAALPVNYQTLVLPAHIPANNDYHLSIQFKEI